MAGLMQRLGQREEAARARVERLREEAARVAGELAAAEEELRRLAITRETIEEVLAGGEAVEADAVVPGAAGSLAGALVVPYRSDESQVAELPVSYRDVLEILARNDEPQGAGQVAAAVGLGSSKAKSEGMRSKLNRLAGRGWITKTDSGAFTLDPAVRLLVSGSI